MGYKTLVAPQNLRIDFSPSLKQYELWKALQPECHLCGGEIKNVYIGDDEKGNKRYVPECSSCGNRNIPQMILGGGAAGGGKAQPMTAKILTPDGWVNMGDIKVGMEVLTPNGGKAKVIAIHPQGLKPINKVITNDNCFTRCCDDHLWGVYIKSDGGRFSQGGFNYKVVDTVKIKSLLSCGTLPFIPIVKPLEYGKKGNDPIDPMSYGEMVVLFNKTYKNPELSSNLKMLPESILNGTMQDRILFVKGLERAGGISLSESGWFEICLKSGVMADDIAEVLRSLGAFAKKQYIKNIDRYRIRFCFEANQSILYEPETHPKHSRYIKAVIPDGIEECQCITLDSDDQLYITDDYIVTHNSYIGSAWVVSSCIRFPGIRAVVARKTIKSLKESTLVTIKKVMKEWGLVEDVNYCINNIENTITFWNESVILLKEMADLPGDIDFSRFGSIEVTIVFVDEASEISERAADVMFSRIRWKTAETFKTPKMFMSCNPAACWLRSRFVQDDDGNLVKCRDGEMFVRFSVFDNPDESFRRIYEASLNKIKDNATRERLLYGNWDFIDSNSMALYKGFSGEKHLISNLKESIYDPLRPLILGFDFNVFPFMTCLISQIDYDMKSVYILEELLGRPKDKLNNTPKFSQYVLNHLAEMKHIGGAIITGDPAGLQRNTQTEDGVNNYTILMSALRKNPLLRPELRLLQKQPSQKNRTEWINELFNGLDGWNIFIDLRVRKLTEDLVYQLRNEDGSKNKKKITDPETGVKYEKYGHCSDVFDYLLCTMLTNSWKKYQRGNSLDKILHTSTISPKFTY